MKSSKELAKKWLSMSMDFQFFLSQNQTQSFLKDLLKFVDRFPLMNDSFLKGESELFNISSQKIQEYMLSNDTVGKYINSSKDLVKQVINYFILSNDQSNLILKQMRLVDYMARGWVAILDPMKLDLFNGFPNETMMLNYIDNVTSNSNGRKPILSAIVFENINFDGSLPRHMFYRIRMNSLTLPSTEKVRTPYWVPGGRGGQSNYFYYGFAWLQDQIERAIIEVQTNQTVVNPGLYVQEMPYPCYLDDK